MTSLDYRKIYREREVIGRGTQGSASLVERIDNKQLFIAKKIILSSLNSKQQEAAQLEAQLLKTLTHKNIVSYVESFKEEDLLIIIMEYCEHGDLGFHIKRKKQKKEHFPEMLIVNWFFELAISLKYIHEKKILHRDIKAQNIFITRDGTIKIGDFGISKVLEHTTSVAKTVIGTPFYMRKMLNKNEAERPSITDLLNDPQTQKLFAKYLEVRPDVSQTQHSQTQHDKRKLVADPSTSVASPSMMVSQQEATSPQIQTAVVVHPITTTPLQEIHEEQTETDSFHSSSQSSNPILTAESQLFQAYTIQTDLQQQQQQQHLLKSSEQEAQTTTTQTTGPTNNVEEKLDDLDGYNNYDDDEQAEEYKSEFNDDNEFYNHDQDIAAAKRKTNINTTAVGATANSYASHFDSSGHNTQKISTPQASVKQSLSSVADAKQSLVNSKSKAKFRTQLTSDDDILQSHQPMSTKATSSSQQTTKNMPTKESKSPSQRMSQFKFEANGNHNSHYNLKEDQNHHCQPSQLQHQQQQQQSRKMTPKEIAQAKKDEQNKRKEEELKAYMRAQTNHSQISRERYIQNVYGDRYLPNSSVASTPQQCQQQQAGSFGAHQSSVAHHNHSLQPLLSPQQQQQQQQQLQRQSSHQQLESNSLSRQLSRQMLSNNFIGSEEESHQLIMMTEGATDCFKTTERRHHGVFRVRKIDAGISSNSATEESEYADMHSKNTDGEDKPQLNNHNSNNNGSASKRSPLMRPNNMSNHTISAKKAYGDENDDDYGHEKFEDYLSDGAEDDTAVQQQPAKQKQQQLQQLSQQSQLKKKPKETSKPASSLHSKQANKVQRMMETNYLQNNHSNNQHHQQQQQNSNHTKQQYHKNIEISIQDPVIPVGGARASTATATMNHHSYNHNNHVGYQASPSNVLKHRAANTTNTNFNNTKSDYASNGRFQMQQPQLISAQSSRKTSEDHILPGINSSKIQKQQQQHGVASSSHHTSGSSQTTGVVSNDSNQAGGDQKLQSLRQKCIANLGADFDRVYDIISKSVHENVQNYKMKQQLVEVVGKAKINECFQVEMLIYQEDKQHQHQLVHHN